MEYGKLLLEKINVLSINLSPETQPFNDGCSCFILNYHCIDCLNAKIMFSYLKETDHYYLTQISMFVLYFQEYFFIVQNKKSSLNN